MSTFAKLFCWIFGHNWGPVLPLTNRSFWYECGRCKRGEQFDR